MRLAGEILTVLIFASGLGLAALAAGVGLDAWWSWCEAMERRSLTGEGRENTTV
jgi:hypothetical protein